MAKLKKTTNKVMMRRRRCQRGGRVKRKTTHGTLYGVTGTVHLATQTNTRSFWRAAFDLFAFGCADSHLSPPPARMRRRLPFFPLSLSPCIMSFRERR